MGVSQSRFAELLGISPATVRNLEQGRTKPTGPTSKLLSIAEQFPQIFIASTSAKLSTGQVQAMLKKVATSASDVKLSARKPPVVARGGRKAAAVPKRTRLAAAR